MAAKKNSGNGIAEHRRQEVQQALKNACDQLNSDGVAPRDYVEQLAWLFFLKAFDEAESRLEQEASFDDRPYVRRLDGEYRWSAWSKNIERPDDMLEFVDAKLWRYLQTFGVNKGSKEFAGDPVAERFRRIFSSVRNHSRRGASFARVVQQAGWCEARTGADSHRIISGGEDVTETEGTGIVHTAPGCGQIDFVWGKTNGLPPIAPIDDSGNFHEGFGVLTGNNAADPATTDAIFEDLKKKDRLFAGENYDHRYPHCWRCKTDCSIAWSTSGSSTWAHARASRVFAARS